MHHCRRFVFASLFLLAAVAASAARADEITIPPPSPPRAVLLATTSAGVPVKVVQINLNSPEVRVTAILSENGPGRSEPLPAMMARTAPAAAITGTFFGSDTLLPIGDIVIEGRLRHFGGRGAALCLAPDPDTGGTRATFRPNAGRDRHTDWSGYETVIAGGMWLVRNGALALDPRAQGFRDPSLFRPNPRVAVGVTRANKLLLVATRRRVTLREWARALRALGAVDALNLDGGSSTALFFEGRTLIRPGRRLTNALVVYTRRDAYERARDPLAPPRETLAKAQRRKGV